MTQITVSRPFLQPYPSRRFNTRFNIIVFACDHSRGLAMSPHCARHGS